MVTCSSSPLFLYFPPTDLSLHPFLPYISPHWVSSFPSLLCPLFSSLLVTVEMPPPVHLSLSPMNISVQPSSFSPHYLLSCIFLRTIQPPSFTSFLSFSSPIDQLSILISSSPLPLIFLFYLPLLHHYPCSTLFLLLFYLCPPHFNLTFYRSSPSFAFFTPLTPPLPNLFFSFPYLPTSMLPLFLSSFWLIIFLFHSFIPSSSLSPSSSSTLPLLVLSH